tara:strand:- start:193 stop:990 length:798 start_codon:yes stop_codon:yes gene_type:complete
MNNFISKISKRYRLIAFILFAKNNYFRNYLLNTKFFNEIKKITPKTNPDLVDFLENIKTLNNSFLQYYPSKPFNSQIKRTKIISSILDNYKPENIIETGTFLGSTTEFFAKYSDNVISVERSELYYLIASSRLQNYENIKLYNNDSAIFLKNYNLSDKTYFFYLDAHWGSGLPVKEELEQIFRIKNFIICIDDFKVPDGQDWGFDTYEEGELSIDYFDLIKSKSIFFPSYSLDEETGAKRGCIFISSKGSCEKILASQKEITKFN